MRIGHCAALVAGLALITTGATAGVVHITIDWPKFEGGGTEALTLDSSAGQADAGQPDFILYPLLSDNMDNSGIVFGDSGAGGEIETGLIAIGCCGVNSLSPLFGDNFSPIIFNGVSADFAPGTYLGADGSTLTISSAPEPASWALMLAGFAALGAALRSKRLTPSAGQASR